MYALIALFLLAFILCFFLTPLCRDIFAKFELVDLPDTDRKFHDKPIPRIGGIPIALSYMGALALMLLWAPHGAVIAVQHRGLLFSLLPAAGVVFATGLVDDLVGLKPWQKLGGQFVAASWAVMAGARITQLDAHPYSALLTVPVSVLWLLVCSNAFNLIDGLDGLASGIGLFATLTTLLAAILQGNWGLAMATVPLAGCLFAFLRYNFNPASIFLGDSGSLTIGFLLGCFGVIWSHKSATFLGMLAPLMALALPLMDVGLSIGRRFLENKPIFKGDRGHIHHRLLALGCDTRTAAIILYIACGIGAILSLLTSSLSYHLGGLILVLFCALAYLGIKRLGYVEFSTASRVLSSGRMRRFMQDEVYLDKFRYALARAQSPADCWKVIRDACSKLDFASLHLSLEGQHFEAIFLPESVSPDWKLQFAFQGDGHMTITRAGQAELPFSMTSFFHVVKQVVEARAKTAGTGLSSEIVMSTTPARSRTNVNPRVKSPV
jgi:UDP-GlcNAc:undecaprenyl-phosphate GlcNAc-1-phosphate transferase